MSQHEDLKKVAEAAPGGPWVVENDSIYFKDDGYTRHMLDADAGHDVEDEAYYAALKFIAAANPAAVLALIVENEQLAKTADCWDRLNVYNKALSDSFRAERDQSEQDYKDVVGTIELRDIEIAKLRAEAAGLRTGYEAYERVNAELKAEAEELRKGAGRYEWLRDKQTFIWLIQDWFPSDAEFTDVDAVIDAAMGKGERS